MFFNQELIEQVEDDPIQGITTACNNVQTRLRTIRGSEGQLSEREHELLWEAASFLQQALDVNDFDLELDFPEASLDIGINCSNLQKYITTISNEFNKHSKELKIKSNINSYTNRYKTAFKSSFTYEFSKKDLSRVQELISELRNHITKNSSLENNHRRRLLKRLEKLQSELHKKVSDLDVFWGLVGDAGVVLGKLGKDAKPIVDRVKEISEIVWKVQAKSEELPNTASNPMLEQDSE